MDSFYDLFFTKNVKNNNEFNIDFAQEIETMTYYLFLELFKNEINKEIYSYNNIFLINIDFNSNVTLPLGFLDISVQCYFYDLF